MLTEPELRSPARIVTVCVKGTPAKAARGTARTTLLERVIQKIRDSGWNKLDAVVLPGGFFYSSEIGRATYYRARRSSIEATAFSERCRRLCVALSPESPGIAIIAGVDGPEGAQFSVAWRRTGVVGVARKVFPTDDEAKGGLAADFEDFGCSHRYIALSSGRTAVLCVCYDMFGLTENPVHPGRRTTILRTIESHGSVLRKGDAAFDELRHRCIQQWDLLLRSRRPSVAIAAIHAFDRPGLDGFWQRHGIATASAVLNGGLALGAAHFRDCLPEPSHSTLASTEVDKKHLGDASRRNAHRLQPEKVLCVDGTAIVRLFSA